ncbi:MAG: YibE/F family protein [Actinobacteria bacterium]|nr:YibE/F family protein [Actinomycetota bacterium]
MQHVERAMLIAVAVLVALTALGMWLLWPGQRPQAPGAPPLYAGRVVQAQDYQCPDLGSQAEEAFGFQRTGPCQRVEVAILEGPGAGETFRIDTAEEDYPAFEHGDRVRVGVATIGEADRTYYVADFARLRPLLVLFLVFVAAAVAVGRWYGVRSLAGLALSLAIIVWFVVPGILAGSNPFAVAVVGAFAIMLVTLYLAHGFTVKTSAALIGTAAALGLTALLGVAFVAFANLTGLASEEASLARFAVEGLDLRGLVLAGLVIGALGVLDDVTVSQASTVFAVHEANPDQSFGEVFRRAMSVGRDHIASTVNTLVLAYVGASIPLIVLFSTGGLPAAEIVNAEIVAEEVVRTLVGSVGLISAVPLTTALATAVAMRRDAGELPVPAHLRDDVDEDELSDEELAHRRWIAYLRSGATEGEPPSVPSAEEDGS